jgi:serine/threonine protein kinase
MSPTGTYNAYIKQNNECLSLFTKLYSLSQILQGMRFLQENKITHMDLKPQNILIGRTLNMKLNDLGEAYHSEHLVNYQPGYSIPYSPPEVHQFTNNSNTTINSKSDVYSFGVILMWNLFSSQPLNVRPSVVDSVIKEMIDGTYANRLIATPISNNQFGP